MNKHSPNISIEIIFMKENSKTNEAQESGLNLSQRLDFTS